MPVWACHVEGGARALWRALAVAGLLTLLVGVSACGGGGGGGGGVALTLLTPELVANYIARNEPPELYLQGKLAGVAPGTQVYLGVSGGQDLLIDAQVNVLDTEALVLALALRPDLAAGTYNASVSVALCKDAACQTQLAEPVTARLRVTVLPNLEVQSSVVLSRSGREDAPAVTIPISVPAAAGELLGGGCDLGIQGQVRDGQLHISTQQLPAGSYQCDIFLQSKLEPGYKATVAVSYTVHPPPDGERPLLMDPPSLQLSMFSGDRVTRRIRVTPPTWSSAPVQARVSEYAPGAISVVRVDDLVFDVTVDATDSLYGDFSQIYFVSGTGAGEHAWLDVGWQVNAAVSLAQSPVFTFDAATTPAALNWRTAVSSADGNRWRWQAVSDSPWLRVTPSSGIAGVDALNIELDAERFSDDAPYGGLAQITLTLDKPGSLAVVVPVRVENQLPAVKLVSPSALVGDRGRLFVSGHALSEDVFQRGDLQVTGARVVRATPHLDRRFAASVVKVLELELDSATPGVPIEVRIVKPALTTQVRVPVLARSALPAGRVSLPDDLYSLPSYGIRQRAWFFVGTDRVWKLQAEAAVWTAGWAALPGVLDVDPLSDESALLAVGSRWVGHLDPVTLALTAKAEPAADLFYDTTIGGQRMTRHKVVAHHVDGDAYALLQRSAPTSLYTELRPLQFNAKRPPATYSWQYGTFPDSTGITGLTVSADRRRFGLSWWDTTPPAYVWQIEAGQSDFLGVLQSLSAAPGPRARMLGVSATSPFTALFDDGTLRTWSSVVVLSGLVPVTHWPAGYALSSDASRVLIHAVRRQGQGATESAGDAQLLVIDLTAQPRVMATLPMQGAVGCLLPRAASQTCDPAAAVVFDPSERAALVIGRQAAEVVPLPDSVAPAAVPAGITQPTRWSAGHQVVLGGRLVRAGRR